MLSADGEVVVVVVLVEAGGRRGACDGDVVVVVLVAGGRRACDVSCSGSLSSSCEQAVSVDDGDVLCVLYEPDTIRFVTDGTGDDDDDDVILAMSTA